METIEEIDRQLFFFINEKHNQWLDNLMPLISSTWFWIPLYLVLAYIICKSKKEKIVSIFICITLVLVLSDQTANFIKKGIQRYRPSHNTEIQHQVHIVDNYTGGQFGFVSSHAANVFSIATFVILLLYNKKNKFKLMLLPIWALLVSYSRIYLGVHYPLDIIGGAFVGIYWALTIYFAYSKFSLRFLDN